MNHIHYYNTESGQNIFTCLEPGCDFSITGNAKCQHNFCMETDDGGLHTGCCHCGWDIRTKSQDYERRFWG